MPSFQRRHLLEALVLVAGVCFWAWSRWNEPAHAIREDGAPECAGLPIGDLGDDPGHWPTSVFACAADSDCTTVSVSSCCGFEAVNKAGRCRVAETPMVCAMMCPPSAVRCIKGSCQVVADLPPR
ncbi:MAG: hypothetical protein HY928_11265 [Elusimicrobia bacterium]|nr:hypothetical protein [Elusimicrobiota bacterium]